MREKIAELLAPIKAFWAKLSKKLKIIILAATAALLVFAIVLVLLLNRVNYELLYSGLTPTENAEAMTVLNELGIAADITDYGAIYVPEEDVNRVRMQMATRGLTGGGFTTYDIYSQAGLTSTQADRNQWFVYQTQNRLQETIETFPEVEQAIVNLSIPQESLYTLGQTAYPPSASVKLSLYPDTRLTAEQIQGIVNIIKDGVAGLTEERISIADKNGDLKLTLNEDNTVPKLLLTENFSNSVKAKLLSLLTPVFGEGGVVVSVSAELDTNSSVIDKTEYYPADPNDPRNNPLDFQRNEAEKIGGDNEVVEGVPGANDNVDVPEYAAEDVDLLDAESYAYRNEYDFLVSSSREQIVKEGYELTHLSVGVVINASNLTDSRRDQVIDLVAKAAGVPNDMVSVQGIPFNTGTPIDIEEREPPDLTTILIITGAALLALAIIFIVLLLQMRKKHREETEVAVMEAAAAVEEHYERENTLAEMLSNREEEEFEPIQLQETQEQKLKVQIRDLAVTDPEIVALLLKTWLSAD